jgi:alkaline phosphatase D
MTTRGVSEPVSDSTPTRRDVLDAAGAVTLGRTLSALSADDAAAARLAPDPVAVDEGFAVEREAAERVFPQSVASGGPTSEGVLLWTRVSPDAYDGTTPLGVEVAPDAEFENTAYRGTVPPGEFGEARDYTATVDVDGELDPDGRYFYRFVYDGAASEVGRCRTLPAPDSSPDSLTLAVASCNNYIQGYFGAFAHIAEEDADFLLHLGDLIYEYGGDGVGDRSIDLPSGKGKAYGLADYRHLYRTYRSDANLRRALRSHTLVHVWDDHEVVSDRWWDYDADAPATEAHPRGDDPGFMRQLYVDAIRAYTEYVPVRAEYEPEASDGEELDPGALQRDFRLYRSFEFGDLADLFLTDERLYRSPPPAADRPGAAAPFRAAARNPGRTMLGDDQREWLVEGMTGSDARWKLWGNEVLLSAFRFVRSDGLAVNADAWDGYWAERRKILSRLSGAGVDNVVALTGDMHSYLAGYLLTNYDLGTVLDSLTDVDERLGLSGDGDRVGVEFMAPAVSSDTLVEMGRLPDFGVGAVAAAIRAGNPHVEWFDSSHWGYATVDMSRDDLVYSAYAVDRSVDSPDAPKKLLRRYRVPAGNVEMRRTD